MSFYRQDAAPFFEKWKVLTRGYLNFGKEGVTQFITQSQIKLKRLINLKTGEIINFK